MANKPSSLQLADPTTLVALFVALQIVAWTLAPALTHTSPPLDVVEGYMWGREWVLARMQVQPRELQSR